MEGIIEQFIREKIREDNNVGLNIHPSGERWGATLWVRKRNEESGRVICSAVGDDALDVLLNMEIEILRLTEGET